MSPASPWVTPNKATTRISTSHILSTLNSSQSSLNTTQATSTHNFNPNTHMINNHQFCRPLPTLVPQYKVPCPQTWARQTHSLNRPTNGNNNSTCSLASTSKTAVFLPPSSRQAPFQENQRSDVLVSSQRFLRLMIFLSCNRTHVRSLRSPGWEPRQEHPVRMSAPRIRRILFMSLQRQSQHLVNHSSRDHQFWSA